LGMHARLAYSLADLCARFDCEIRLGFGDARANAKSMMEILELGAGPGETLTLETSGPGSDATLNELVRFFDTEAKTL